MYGKPDIAQAQKDVRGTGANVTARDFNPTAPATPDAVVHGTAKGPATSTFK